MKKIFKRIFIFLVIGIVSLALFACDKGPKKVKVTFDYGYKVNDDKNEFVFEVVKGEKLAGNDIASLLDPKSEDVNKLFLNWLVKEGQVNIKGNPYQVDEIATITFNEDAKFVPNFRTVKSAEEIIKNLDEKAFTFFNEETIDNLKTKIIVPGKVLGKQITWVSESPKLLELKEDGTEWNVIVKERPEELTKVKLTATITNDTGQVASKDFEIKVLPKANEKLLQAFKEKYNETLGKEGFLYIDQDIEFYKTFTFNDKEYKVEWSSKEDAKYFDFANNEIKEFPFKGNEDTPEYEVVIKFNFSGNNSEGTEGTFGFKIKRAMPTLEEDLEYQWRTILETFPSATFIEDDKGNKILKADGLKSEIENRKERKLFSTGETLVYTWESSSPETINNDGKIEKIPLDKDIEITYTITTKYNGKTYTKKLVFIIEKVKACTPKEALKVKHGEKVLVKGILTSLAANGTYFLQDDVAAIAVYTVSCDALTEYVGKKIEVIGERGHYNGLEQIKKIAIDAINVLDEDPELPTAIDLNTLADYKAETLKKHQSKLVNVKDMIVSNIAIDSTDGNVECVLTNKDNPDFKINFRWDARVKAAHIGDDVVAKIKELEDHKIVSATNLILGWYNGPQLSASKHTKFTIVLPERTDEEKVKVAKAHIETKIEDVYKLPVTIDLPTEYQGATIVWESSDEEAINSKTGEIKLGSEEKQVTLKATITAGSESDVFEKTVTVAKEVTVKTVENALNANVGEKIVIEGILTALATNGTYFLQDETAAIAVHTKDNDNLFEYCGKKIRIIGERDSYNGLEQIKDIEIASVKILDESPELPTAIDLNTLADYKAETLKKHQSKLVNVKDMVISNFKKDKNGTITCVLTSKDNPDFKINFRWDYRVSEKYLTQDIIEKLASFAEGKTVSATNLILGWFKNPQLAVGRFTTLEVL